MVRKNLTDIRKEGAMKIDKILICIFQKDQLGGSVTI